MSVAHKVPSTSLDELASFGGKFLIPIYSETDLETGRKLWGLAPKEFQLVTTGLACPECLADYGGMYRPRCPVCGHERDVVADVDEEPVYWKPDPTDPDRRG